MIRHVAVGPVLDTPLSSQLEDDIAAAAVAGSTVCIDFTDLEAFTDSGIAALVRSSRLAAAAGARLSYRAASRAGRRAVIAVLSSDCA